VRDWLLYTALRVLAFAIPFGILSAIGLEWWIAAPIAAVVGFCLSYVLLRTQRDRVALRIVEARAAAGTPRADEDAEDAPPAPPAV
jgi:hypothetical protein